MSDRRHRNRVALWIAPSSRFGSASRNVGSAAATLPTASIGRWPSMLLSVGVLTLAAPITTAFAAGFTSGFAPGFTTSVATPTVSPTGSPTSSSIVAGAAHPVAADDAPAAARKLHAAVTDAITPERLEAMLDAESEAPVIQTFRRHPNRVLPFIDGYLEGGLALLEKATEDGTAEKDMLPDDVSEKYTLALRFAALADRAFGETIFTEYAANFVGWSPQERERFRTAQRLHREGREAFESDPERALRLYRQSFLLSESVGDHWGMAMNQDGIAAAGGRTDRLDEAHEAAIKAVSLNGRLQLRMQHIRSMLAAGRLQAKMDLPGGGVQYLLLARQMLPPHTDPTIREEIVAELITALEAAGRLQDIERITREERRRADLLSTE